MSDYVQGFLFHEFVCVSVCLYLYLYLCVWQYLCYASSSSVPVWGGESRFVVSERVIISRQDGRGWGVATGYIKSLHNTAIDIVINKWVSVTLFDTMLVLM